MSLNENNASKLEIQHVHNVCTLFYYIFFLNRYSKQYVYKDYVIFLDILRIKSYKI